MKTIITCFIACAWPLFFMSSCTKSDLESFVSDHNLVRIYDDTLSHPASQSIHMAAGNNRLLMTYGHTQEVIFAENGSATFPYPAKNVWMLTDFDGNLIKRDRIPTGLAVSDVLALPDNSFLLIAHTGIPNLWGGPPWELKLLRLDPNGVMGPAITLNIPNSQPPYQQFRNIRLILTPNGNALIHLTYSDALISGNFVAEMDMYGNFLWHKQSTSLYIENCVVAPGGGYMVSALTWDDQTLTSTKIIMKTNSNFDSTWSRIITPAQEFQGGLQIASDGNGSYLLNYSIVHNNKAFSYFYSVDMFGEIRDSTFYPILNNLGPYNIRTVMLSGDFILHGLDFVGSTVLNKFNSSYVTLDGNLNITKQSSFQNQTSDMINTCCRLPDNRIACFGITQSYDRRYYKPILIIVD